MTREALSYIHRRPEFLCPPVSGEVAGCSRPGQGDRPGALAVATRGHNLGWDPAVDAYGAARMLAQCMPIVEKDDKLAPANRQAEIAFYADQAMAMLRDALAKGYKDAGHMRTDKDLDPLRSRADFKAVVAELEAKVKKN